jgi:hypothetical protein
LGGESPFDFDAGRKPVARSERIAGERCVLAKKKTGGRRCRPFPISDQREEVLAEFPKDDGRRIPPFRYFWSTERVRRP